MFFICQPNIETTINTVDSSDSVFYLLDNVFGCSLLDGQNSLVIRLYIKLKKERIAPFLPKRWHVRQNGGFVRTSTFMAR